MIPLLITLLVLALVLLMPLTVKIAYHGALTVRAGIFFPFLKVVPRRKKTKQQDKKTPETHKEAKSGQQKEEKPKKKGNAKMWMGLLRKLLWKLPRIISVRRVKLKLQLGSEDPGDLAMTYGGVSALTETVVALFAPRSLSRWNVQIIPDFERTKTEVDGELCVATNLWRLLSVLISLILYVILSNKEIKGDLKNG